MIDNEILEKIEIEELMEKVEFIYDLKKEMEYITDKREEGYVLHSLDSIVLTIIFAIFARCNTIVEICLFIEKHYNWLDKNIGYENGAPSRATIGRIMAILDPKEIEKICIGAFKKFLSKNGNIYENKKIEIEDIKTMDGKTANSSDRESSKEGKISKMNAMSIYSLKNQYCEATEFIEEKTNEIPTGI